MAYGLILDTLSKRSYIDYVRYNSKGISYMRIRYIYCSIFNNSHSFGDKHN